MQFKIKLYYTILYYTILYYTILYYTILYYTILYYTILYYTIQNLSYDCLLKPSYIKSKLKSKESITYLINLSIEQSVIPAEWKSPMVTPIFKSGDKSI